MTPADCAAYIYERLWLADEPVKAASATEFVSALGRAVRLVTGRGDPVNAMAHLVVRAAREELPQRARVPAPVLPRWLLTEVAEALASQDDEWVAARDRAAFALMHQFALRPGELRLMHVDEAHFRRTNDGSYAIEIVGSKTNQRHRRREILQVRHIEGCGPACPHCATTGFLRVRTLDLPGDFLLANDEVGGPMDEAGLADRVAHILDGFPDQIEGFSLYTLRRSRATHAYLAGWPLRMIRRLMRHARIATTELYVARFGAWMSVDDAANLHLAESRPAGFVGEFGQARRAWEQEIDHDLDIDEVRELAVDAAVRGRSRLSNRAEAERVGTNFERWCLKRGRDPYDPAEGTLIAWARHLRSARDLKGTTIEGYLYCVRSWLLDRDVATIVPVDTAHRLSRQWQREDAESRVPDRATVFSENEWERMAAVGPKPHTTTALNRAVVRYEMASLGVPLVSPRRAVTVRRSDIVDRGDRVDVTIGGRTVILMPRSDKRRCPVRALRALLADGEDDLSKWKLETSTLYYNGGLTTSVEAWTPTEFATATDRLAEPYLRAARGRMAVAVMFGGALRCADLLEADTRDLVRTSLGYELHLGRSKLNRTGRLEVIALGHRNGHGPLCPPCALDDWLGWWPLEGALYPGDLLVEGREASEGDPVPPAVYSTVLNQLKYLGREAELGTGVSCHSPRRSRATQEWERTRDLIHVKRLLRHSSLDMTKRYVEGLDVFSAAVTEQLFARAQAQWDDGSQPFLLEVAT